MDSEANPEINIGDLVTLRRLNAGVVYRVLRRNSPDYLVIRRMFGGIEIQIREKNLKLASEEQIARTVANRITR